MHGNYNNGYGDSLIQVKTNNESDYVRSAVVMITKLIVYNLWLVLLCCLSQQTECTVRIIDIARMFNSQR